MDDFVLRARELTSALLQIQVQKWMDTAFVTPGWWLLLGFLIIPWIIWMRLVDNKRILEIFLIGTLVIIITTILDVVGYFLNFWDYPVELIPTLPGASPFDLSMVPVPYMLLYQFCRTWKTYCIGLVSMAIIYSFIGEPWATWFQLVVYMKWTYVYSFVYYIITGICVRGFVERLKAVSR